MRGMSVELDARASAPLITLFERDDSIAVPLLSQLRMAGYDVRSARTPVELFDILGKNLVTLVLVDLGAATAGRREFWVALDAQRRGRSMQVLTFRYMTPASDLDLDFEPSARAIADVEIHGAHEFQRVIEAVRQRAPLHGPAPSAAVSYTADGGIQPLGAALGLAPTPYSEQFNGGYGAYGAPSPQPGFALSDPSPFGAGYGGTAFGSQPPGMGGYQGGYQGMPNSMPPGAFSPAPSMPSMQGYGAPIPPQFDAQMETTPFPESVFAQGGFAPPFGSPFAAQPGFQASPFAHPTSVNPFANQINPLESSPFAQPYGSNPFADASAPSTPPASPFAQGVGQAANPFGPGMPSAPTGPGAPWGQSPGGYLADAPQFADWHTPDTGPDSFGSDPGARSMFGAPQSPAGAFTPLPMPSTPVFQDAWTPPDGEIEMETSALPEDAFQTGMPGMPGASGMAGAAGASAWSAATSEPRRRTSEPQYDSTQLRPWDAPRSGGGLSGESTPPPFDYSASQQDGFERSTASLEQPQGVSAMQTQTPASTPTETSLGSVLVEGALLTPGKLETLRGIQAMLTSVNQPRKLGELAVMFKFLSPDQLLAALLVSRGLVSPQQIASLGRLKQELAATGKENDLETLLVRFNMLPADQLRNLRQELAS